MESGKIFKKLCIAILLVNLAGFFIFVDFVGEHWIHEILHLLCTRNLILSRATQYCAMRSEKKALPMKFNYSSESRKI